MKIATLNINQEIMKKDKSHKAWENEKNADWLSALVCLTFFPLLYLVGKTIKLWLE